MKDMNRDLWLLCKNDHMTQSELDRQVNLLNTLLYHTESWPNFCVAHEILDINRRKIISKPHLMQGILQEREMKAFVFVNNLN
jgi:hypothetical protein